MLGHNVTAQVGLDKLDRLSLLYPMTESFKDVIELWPSLSELGQDIDVNADAARKWKQRDSVPGEFWGALVEAAQKRGLEGVTLELLAQLASRDRAA